MGAAGAGTAHPQGVRRLNMSLEELKTLMDTLDVESVYGYFPKEKKPPYIAYQAETAQSINADGIVVLLIANVTLTLVTARRDMGMEQQISDLLTANDVDFGEPEYEFDPEQEIHKTSFYFQTID
jgi:hypothetical protein